jgi:hypothetical protein
MTVYVCQTFTRLSLQDQMIVECLVGVNHSLSSNTYCDVTRSLLYTVQENVQIVYVYRKSFFTFIMRLSYWGCSYYTLRLDYFSILKFLIFASWISHLYHFSFTALSVFLKITRIFSRFNSLALIYIALFRQGFRYSTFLLHENPFQEGFLLIMTKI